MNAPSGIISLSWIQLIGRSLSQFFKPIRDTLLRLDRLLFYFGSQEGGTCAGKRELVITFIYLFKFCFKHWLEYYRLKRMHPGLSLGQWLRGWCTSVHLQAGLLQYQWITAPVLPASGEQHVYLWGNTEGYTFPPAQDHIQGIQPITQAHLLWFSHCSTICKMCCFAEKSVFISAIHVTKSSTIVNLNRESFNE